MVTLLVTIGILLLIILWAVSSYNKLVRSKNLMQDAWSGIDVFLKKRHDLVPNVVNAVKGYASHEKETRENVVRLRLAAMQTHDRNVQIESEAGLGKALGRLMAISEQYPELKASQNFLDLQQQLASLENELSTARRYYNGTVRENNTLIESFPTSIFANMTNFPLGKFFEIEKAAREVPRISF
jgi:LemA protein